MKPDDASSNRANQYELFVARGALGVTLLDEECPGVRVLHVIVSQPRFAAIRVRSIAHPRLC